MNYYKHSTPTAMQQSLFVTHDVLTVITIGKYIPIIIGK